MSCPLPTLRRHAFTLVELLVVIAIIGVLVALLLPAVQAAREAARRAQCSNNLKQVALAILNYESSHKVFPAGHTVENANAYASGVYQTWTVDILPGLEQQAIYDLWDKNTRIDTSALASTNQQLRSTIIDAYRCPSDQFENNLDQPESGPMGGGVTEAKSNWAVSSYRANAGRAGVGKYEAYWDDARIDTIGIDIVPPEWRGPIHAVNKRPENRRELSKPVALRQITDGVSNTLLVGEYHTLTNPRRKTFWAYGYTSFNLSGAYPESPTLLANYERCTEILTKINAQAAQACKRAWGSLHSGNLIQFANCDGSVITMSTDVDLEAFLAVSTIQNGEVLTLGR